jgi:hypothetical protein
MYPTQLDSAIGVMNAGFVGALVGAGLGAGSAIANRGAAQRAGQQGLDLEHKKRENEFQERQGGSFGERNAFKQRLLGNLGNSFINTSIGAGEPGSAGRFNLQRLDPKALFSAITAGQFGEDLRGATTSGINEKVDFTAPKFESSTSLLGDILGGAASGAGSMGLGGLFGGGGGGGNIPIASGGFNPTSAIPGAGNFTPGFGG